MKYLFTWEPEKQSLFFIDQKAHKSGVVMKNLDHVQPHVIEELQKILEVSHPIGSVITIRWYTFIISRKHYAGRHDLALVDKALASLSGPHKMTAEDFPDIVNLARKYSSIEIYDTSDWDKGSAAFRKAKP